MRLFVGLNATLETDNWRYRLTYASTYTSQLQGPFNPLLDALAQVPTDVWPDAESLRNHLKGAGKQTHYFSAGFVYDNSKWLVQSELALMTSKWASLDMTNGYLSIGRRFHSFTFYTVGSYAKSRKRLRTGGPLVSTPELDFLATAAQFLANASYTDQNTVSVGMRWDLHPQLALKAQWDHTWVRKNGGGLLVLREPVSHDITLNTVSLNLNFVF